MKNNLTIYQGADFGLQITCQQAADLSPFNFDGYTFIAQVKSTPADDTPVVTFTVTNVGVPAAGVLLLALTGVQTTLMVDDAYVWDIFGASGGVSTRIAGGDISVVPQVSREAV